MFPEAFVTETLAKHPGATTADAERISAWIAAKHTTQPFSNPHGMFDRLLAKAAAENATAAKFPIAKPKSRAEELPYVGFDQYGATIRSATPVNNPQTDFANWIIREIRDQLLSPADVVRIVRQRDAGIWNAIGVHTLTHWATHAHWTRDSHGNPVRIERDCDVSCWASLSASSGMGESIRSWGGWYPWSRDLNSWESICHRDEARRTPAA